MLTPRSVVAGVVAGLLGLGACSSEPRGAGSTTDDDEVTGAPSTTIAELPEARSCPPPPARGGAPGANVTAVDRDSYDLMSHDDVRLRVNFVPAVRVPAPTLLVSPGWASLGATLDTPSEAFAGSLAIDALTRRGYNVVTWDRRGFGASDGVVALGDPAIEGGDVIAIVDWIATRPEVVLDGARDPRLGMFGGSYGAGIQLVAAAIDCRVDAIAPNMVTSTWRNSLAKDDTTKVGWINLLVSSTDATLAPELLTIAEIANDDGVLGAGELTYLDSLGPGALVDAIEAPTLVVQGTVDTLFTLDDAIRVFERARAGGGPAAMVWYCGGHGVCPTGRDDAWVAERVVAWLDRHVRRIDARPGELFTTVDQTGAHWSSDTWPLPVRASARGSGAGTLALVAASRAGPPAADDSTAAGMANVMRLITPALVASPHTLEADVEVAPDALIVGRPRLRLRYRGRADTPEAGARPTRVFAQLVDPVSGAGVGGQITPIAVVLDGDDHELAVDLEAVAWHAPDDGGSLVLQLVASTPLYTTPRLGGSIEFTAIDIELPDVGGSLHALGAVANDAAAPGAGR